MSLSKSTFVGSQKNFKVERKGKLKKSKSKRLKKVIHRKMVKLQKLLNEDLNKPIDQRPASKNARREYHVHFFTNPILDNKLKRPKTSLPKTNLLVNAQKTIQKLKLSMNLSNNENKHLKKIENLISRPEDFNKLRPFLIKIVAKKMGDLEHFEKGTSYHEITEYRSDQNTLR
jgi:hypothetical protein